VANPIAPLFSGQVAAKPRRGAHAAGLAPTTDQQSISALRTSPRFREHHFFTQPFVITLFLTLTTDCRAPSLDGKQVQAEVVMTGFFSLSLSLSLSLSTNSVGEAS
jgi:hypothetical protein